MKNGKPPAPRSRIAGAKMRSPRRKDFSTMREYLKVSFSYGEKSPGLYDVMADVWSDLAGIAESLDALGEKCDSAGGSLISGCSLHLLADSTRHCAEAVAEVNSRAEFGGDAA